MGIEVDSPCGPGAPCRARLEAMEVAHWKALQEMQEKHAREIRELEEQRDKMLQEESQAAAQGKSDSSVRQQKLRGCSLTQFKFVIQVKSLSHLSRRFLSIFYYTLSYHLSYY